jgi:hypothetical protein
MARAVVGVQALCRAPARDAQPTVDELYHDNVRTHFTPHTHGCPANALARPLGCHASHTRIASLHAAHPPRPALSCWPTFTITVPQNSNLVLQADRSLIDRRNKNESTGEVTSLVGKVDSMRMGDKALRTRPANLDERKEKRARREAKEEESHLKEATGGGLLQDDTSLGLRYRPKTRETQRTYELLLGFITDSLGSQPHDILCGAADEVLDTLKNDNLKAKVRVFVCLCVCACVCARCGCGVCVCVCVWCLAASALCIRCGA